MFILRYIDPHLYSWNRFYILSIHTELPGRIHIDRVELENSYKNPIKCGTSHRSDVAPAYPLHFPLTQITHPPTFVYTKTYNTHRTIFRQALRHGPSFLFIAQTLFAAENPIVVQMNWGYAIINAPKCWRPEIHSCSNATVPLNAMNTGLNPPLPHPPNTKLFVRITGFYQFRKTASSDISIVKFYPFSPVTSLRLKHREHRACGYIALRFYEGGRQFFLRIPSNVTYHNVQRIPCSVRRRRMGKHNAYDRGCTWIRDRGMSKRWSRASFIPHRR